MQFVDRLLFEKLPHGVLALDRSGALVAANPAAVALLGAASLEALQGHGWLEALEQAQRAEVLTALTGATAGAATRLMLRPVHMPGMAAGQAAQPPPDAPAPLVQLDACTLPEAEPTLWTLAVLQPAGEQARELETLREREALYRLFAEGTNDFITLRETDGTFVYGSQTFQRHLGRAPAPTLAALLERFHPDDREMGRQAWNEVVAGTSRYTTFRYLHADGSWHWLEAWGTRVSYRGRAHVLSVSRDITARVQAEQDLRHSEERFRAIVEAWVDLVGIVDSDGRFLHKSPACLRLLGHDCAGIAGLGDLWPLVHADDAPRARAWFHAIAARDGVPPPGPLRMQDKEGRWRSIEWRFNDLRENAAIGGIVLYAHDITEQLALQAQLHQAQKLESVGRFAGGIAHDFNNVLAGVLGLAAMALRQLDPGHEAAHALRHIERAAERGRDLARQILTFARRQPLVLRDVALTSVVADATALARAALPAHVRLALKIDEEPLHVQGDPVQIEQVVSNLITNAAQALPPSGGVVEVGVDRAQPEVADAGGAGDAPAAGAPAGAPHVHLWVRDTGCGMDAATRERIFEPFFTTKAPGAGTGLGLSVVHGIVKAHGGVISVQSTPGRGSTFHVHWPQRRAPAPVAPAAAPAAPQGHGEPVVVVDDDEVLLIATAAQLERLGYAVQPCRSVEEALAAVAPGAVRLVVSDLHIGAGSGLDLARRLRAQHPGVPVVLMSGFVPEALEQAARDIGVRAVLPKGQLMETLAPVVRAILGGTDGR